MATSLKDQLQRTQALDTERSFIVQAPAGSGKTELLVQRYLALLCESVTPEAVIALTFTRKAAAEMKQRVLDTLQLASDATASSYEHYQKTRRELGEKLYQWQTQQKWDLLAHPERLQILTIDAFYAQLARKVPLHSGLTATTKVLEDPIPLYQEAIQQLFAELEKTSQLQNALMRLADHLNNDIVQIERLLVHMLMHRDQWMGIVPKGTHAIEQLKGFLEESLKQLGESAYKKAEDAFLKLGIEGWQEQLQSLMLAIYHPPHEETTPLLSSSDFWKLMADILLTKQGEWRKTITHPGIKRHPEALQKSIKAALKKWLSVLEKEEPVRLALRNISQLPPIAYTDIQWDLLGDLFYILNALLASLEVLFQQYNQIDYIAIALKASQLLGETDPTDLLLSLDYQIQHILVDEFQDTSLQQLRFLNRLTEGWQPKDGRTLFLVGDPMQSIYRFRKAEARLFSLVQQSGLGTCELESIALSTNFRATPRLIQWVNRHFEAMNARIKKQYAEKSLLQHSSAANLSKESEDSHPAVQTHWLDEASAEKEACEIVKLIQSKLEDTGQLKSPSIAILARSRQHLLPILAQLRTEGILHQAIDIETLADQPMIQDLLALTRSLTHLGDDVAWLALLRAPWCGLKLADLYNLTQACQEEEPSRLVWEQLQALDQMTLQPGSKERLRRFIEAIAPVVQSYGRLSLRERILEAWYRLNGPFTQPYHSNALENIERFLTCVDELQVGETLIDSHALEAKLKTVYAATGSLEEGQVALMTIHKAKGLEFDIVIIPSLHKSTRGQSHALILFDEMPTLGTPHVLVAPIKASDTVEPDLIYRYLRHTDTQHHQMEVVRLFYVACTRAKQALHLFGSVGRNDEGEVLNPSTGTFLNWLWPTLNEAEKTLVVCDAEAVEVSAIQRKLKRRVVNTETFGE